MKNKQKLWRRNAVLANRSAGAKHQGRKWKYLSYVNVGKLAVYPLLHKLMVKASLWKSIEKTEGEATA